MRIPGKRAVEIQADFSEGHNILGIKAQRAILERNITPHKKMEGKGSSQGVMRHSDPHGRSSHAPKLEDRSAKETLKQERCVCKVAWEMTKSILPLKEKDKATFCSLSEVWSLPAPPWTKPEEK